MSELRVGDVVESLEHRAIGIVAGFYEHGTTERMYKNVLIDWILAPSYMHYDRENHFNGLGNYDAGDEQLYFRKNFQVLGHIGGDGDE